MQALLLCLASRSLSNNPGRSTQLFLRVPPIASTTRQPSLIENVSTRPCRLVIRARKPASTSSGFNASDPGGVRRQVAVGRRSRVDAHGRSHGGNPDCHVLDQLQAALVLSHGWSARNGIRPMSNCRNCSISVRGSQRRKQIHARGPTRRSERRRERSAALNWQVAASRLRRGATSRFCRLPGFPSIRQ